MMHRPFPACPVVRVEDLSKRFGSLWAVDSVSFEVPAGAIVGLLGGNGAGKTTTLAVLLGLLLPTSGSAMVFGEDVVRHRHRVLPRMNFSSPYVDLPRRLNVLEVLKIFGHLYGISRVEKRAREVARELDMEAFLATPVGNLSAGQKTRVGLAKALLNEPALLILDEPTASLDPDTADWVRGYLEAFHARTRGAILLASHNMGEVERLCDLVLMMREGRIVDRGTPAELIARYGRRTLEEVFLDIARGRSAETRVAGAGQ